MSSKVLISGAGGFLALHIVGQLLTDGYSVIGTVRSQSSADKLLKQFKAKFPDADLQFVVIPDISVPDSFDAVFQEHKDIKWVLHTASPFSFGLEGELDEIYLKPAVNGTLNALKSIQKYAPQVEKVVVTSSFAALENRDKFGDSSFVYTEETWNPVEWSQVSNELVAYVASKKLAERAAWDFVKSNDVNFKLNTVNPPYIFGPQYFEEDISIDNLNTSASILGSLLKTDPSDTHLFDEGALLSADVRDVAKTHVLALSPKIQNERLFLASGRYTPQLALNIINDHFKELNGKIAKGQPEKEETIWTPPYDNSKTVAVLGDYKFKPLETQVIDTIAQLLRVSKL